MKNLLQKLLKLVCSLFKKEEIEPVATVESGQTVQIEPTSAETNNNETIEGNNQMETEYDIFIIIDNGHASSTPGKRSPKDSEIPQFFEYEFNRDIASRLSKRLTELGIKHKLIVPEVDKDISLSERANRANALCKQYGKSKCIFISIHADAAGNGDKWMNAQGWSCYTSVGETASDIYAEIFMREAQKVLVPLGRNIRKNSENKWSKEDNFTVLVKTVCPAILTENLFYDNKEEVKFLQSEVGKEAITQIHINSILKIAKSLAK